MKDLKHPAKSLYQNELNLEDGIIASKEDYHSMISSNKKGSFYISVEVFRRGFLSFQFIFGA